MERDLQEPFSTSATEDRLMKTTIGQVVSELYTSYQRRYHDEELAALATQVVLSELLAALARETTRPVMRPHQLRRAA